MQVCSAYLGCYEKYMHYCYYSIGFRLSSHSPLTSDISRHFDPEKCCSLDIFFPLGHSLMAKYIYPKQWHTEQLHRTTLDVTEFKVHVVHKN